MITSIKYWIKSRGFLPVYRVDVLRYAYKRLWKDTKHKGLCFSLHWGLVRFLGDRYFYKYCNSAVTIHRFFPLYERRNAFQFGALSVRKSDSWWWIRGDLDNRQAFLAWLIDEYKNDKTDLRKLV